MALNITSGTVNENTTTYDSASPTYSMSINGNQITGYTNDYPVYNPAGFFSRPMPGRTGIFHLSPYGGTGYVHGFANESPGNGTNNINDLVDGEVAICETSGFNFNIKAKVDKLLSTFKNSNGTIINSNIVLSENVVTCLIDVFAEIVALEQAYNTFTTAIYPLHTHSGVTSGPNNSGPIVGAPPTPYTATSNFTRDKNFLTNPDKMYISVNGVLIS